jgi:hypothetical protein
MQHSTSECAAGTPKCSASRKTCLATNKSSDSKCNHAPAAVSVTARNPEMSVRTLAPTSAPLANALTNVDHTACASALWNAVTNAAAYIHPIAAKGAHDDITARLTFAPGAPIIIPYSGRTATVAALKSVSGRAFAAIDERSRPAGWRMRGAGTTDDEAGRERARATSGSVRES